MFDHTALLWLRNRRLQPLHFILMFFFNLKALLLILSRQQDGGEELTVNMVIGLFSRLSSFFFFKFMVIFLSYS